MRDDSPFLSFLKYLPLKPDMKLAFVYIVKEFHCFIALVEKSLKAGYDGEVIKPFLAKLSVFVIFIGNSYATELYSSSEALEIGIIDYTEDRPNEPEVGQREYIYSQFPEHNFVQTTGVYTCIALVAWNPYDKSTILAHLDAGTDIESELDRLSPWVDWNTAQISLLGGLSQRTVLRDKIHSKVVSLGGSVSYIIQNSAGSRGINLRVNLENGEVSFFRPKFSTTTPAEMRAKHSRLLRGSRLFRHIDSIGGGDPLEINEDNPDDFFFIMNSNT
ncbi:MAG: hypothetical protein CME65_02540 [Halobacteriovoraceae bacterium]|nr:hypothetical protein [Halobacteriovoraceae bacterium]